MRCLPYTSFVCFAVALGADATASTVNASRVPPGFEDIVHGQVEQIEIRMLGKTLGIFPVLVRPDTVRLETPEAVAAAIGLPAAARDDADASGTSPVAASRLAALARPMARNGHLACDTGCGYLDTETADVIFDEQRGSLDLFLAKAWLPVPDTTGQPYYANAAGSERALIHSQVINAAGSGTQRNLTVLGNGALGITSRSFAGFDWSLVHTGQHGQRGTSEEERGADRLRASLNSLYYRHDLGPAHYTQFGRMDQRDLSSTRGGSFGFSLLPVHRFDGVRVGTSQAYVNERHAAQGSPLTVLLTRDARVDAYRGNELLGSAYLPAGVQSIDTRYFPEGTYLVSLRIIEADTLVRTASEPFTKVGGGAFEQRLQWFGQAGRVADERHGRGDTDALGFTAQAGVRTPVGGGVLLTSGVGWVPSALYNETQLSWRHAFAFGTLTLAGSALVGTGGAYGNTQSIALSNGLGLSVYRYQMRDTSCAQNTAALGASALNLGCYDSLNAALSVPLGAWQASAGYGYNKTHGRALSTAKFPEVPMLVGDADVRHNDRVSRTLQATLSRTFRWRRLSVASRVGVYERRGTTRGSGAMGTATASRDTGAFVSLTFAAHCPKPAAQGATTYSTAGVEVRTGEGARRSGAQTGYQASHAWTWDDTSRRELAVGVSGEVHGDVSATVRGAIDGRYGDANAMLSGSARRDGIVGGDRVSFTGGYASSLAITRERVLLGPAFLAGEAPAAVAIVVARDDARTPGAAARLDVGGRPVTVDFGGAAIVPVSGYRLQSGEVSEATSGVHDHTVSLVRGASRRDYFLTPGRVVTHDVSAGRSYTYVGRALGPDGLSLDHAQVLSVSAQPLDDQGVFMIESPRQLSALYLLSRGQPLRCAIDVTRREDVVHVTGTTQCEALAQETLPEGIRADTRVQRLLSQRERPVQETRREVDDAVTR
ncbi:TcfC E-set like domain-containing protein [Pandoraea pneumonica]|uniref:TcfC E-set like domain-containing protein n=1 Tax=Pandoraea pneumonica TaxID=2508299 RepID=UPI003CE6BB8F